jgi:hypothetical protein
MNQTQQLIDDARAWLADPRNEAHPDRADIENHLHGLEGRPHSKASRADSTEADMALQIIALFNRADPGGQACGSPGLARTTQGTPADTEARVLAAIASSDGK